MSSLIKRLYSTLPCFNESRAYAYINIDNLKNNYRQLTKDISARPICVLKADAYGHGAGECAKALYLEGCDFFAVSSAEEAIDIRTSLCNINGSENADILILGYTPPKLAPLLSKSNITQSGISLEYCKELSESASTAGVQVKIHIALDTGMNRIGLCAHGDSEINAAIDNICLIFGMHGLQVCGMFSHFSNADSYPDNTTQLQFDRFMRVKDELNKKGHDTGFCHICNSAASARYPHFHLDGIRLGISLYGYPAEMHDKRELLPVMRLEAIISHIHKMMAGEHLGYGGDYVASSDRIIATLPIGYADGFIREYKNSTVTVIHDSTPYKAHLVGRICMDQCMVDVTDIPNVSVCDRVVLFGDDQYQLSDMSHRAKSFEYQALCLISSRIPRIYTGGDENES